MATPIYQGAGQPTATDSGGWFGRLGSFFGSGTPAYQPAPTSKATESTAPVESVKSADSDATAEPSGCGTDPQP